MFSVILVPLDGSEGAQEALPAAKHLAKLGNGRIRLVRAASAPTIIDYGAEGILRDALRVEDWSNCEKCLEKVAASVRSEGYTVETAVLDEGNAAERVLADAENSGADIIVLTSHGRTGLARFLLGSVAERITRHATCPVLLVGHEAIRRAHSETHASV